VAVYRTGAYDRAIQDFTAAIRLKPDYPNAFNNRGSAYVEEEHLDRAIQDFDEAVRLQPNNAMALRNRAATYAKMSAGDPLSGLPARQLEMNK
jgi:tetratricopeptide (TPR) repeat protein